MKKGNRGNSKVGLKRGGQSKNANFQMPSFLQSSKFKQYLTEKNIYMAFGIASAVGAITYFAFKFVPWDRIREKIEEEFDSLQKGEFTPQTVDAL